jgi:NAD(P)-dependent dehydrogenase (short-subunit alcohol dehydrogenase family)
VNGLIPLPEGQVDEHGQQLDLRENNSWRLRLGDINLGEFAEVQLVNVISTFALCNGLCGVMSKTSGRKFIVNVSAMEGNYSRIHKTEYHPYTNMGKAALNMLTRTSSAELQKNR